MGTSGKVESKVVIVTGGGSGIGRAGATLLASEGARVVIADIDEEKGQRVCNSILERGEDALFIPVDVRSTESVQELVRQTVGRWGRIDGFFHNAMDVHFVNTQDRRLTEMPDETWDYIIDLVLTGTFRCLKHVGQQMAAQKSGSIVLTATADALIGCAGLDAYTAAKGGVISVTRSFAAGMAKDGVRVNAICPSIVSTEPQQDWLERPESQAMNSMLHLLPIASPEDIAPLVVYLISTESSVVTGTVIPIDSGYMAFKANVDLMAAVSGSKNS
jgi:NAD(P)-dependent dehydrogenase (short-subunit alcohol dehydrogenase family)